MEDLKINLRIVQDNGLDLYIENKETEDSIYLLDDTEDYSKLEQRDIEEFLIQNDNDFKIIEDEIKDKVA